MALRSLGLINGQNQPTTQLAALVKAQGSPDFPNVMKEAMRFGYPFLAKLDLLTATPSMFADAFKAASGAKEDVLKKCRRFYLQAAADVIGNPDGPRIRSGAGKAPPSRSPPEARPEAGTAPTSSATRTNYATQPKASK